MNYWRTKIILNRRTKVILTLLAVVSVSLLLVYFAKQRQDQRRSAELYMLSIISGRLWSHVYAGGQLPTNWLALSNSINSDLLAGIAERYGTPPLSEMYSVLSKPVYFDDRVRTGLIFLVRSEPRDWPARTQGRYVLAITSNQVIRIWYPEDYLPSEVRSQLTNRP